MWYGASPYCDVLPTVKPIKINYCNLIIFSIPKLSCDNVEQ